MSKEYGVVDKSMYDQLESHAAALEADNAALRAEVERLRGALENLLSACSTTKVVQDPHPVTVKLLGAPSQQAVEQARAALQAGKGQG